MERGRGLGTSKTKEEGREGKGLKESKEGRGRERWGFDHLKGISKYITFKGSKGRYLL